jgi:hypothetical protein
MAEGRIGVVGVVYVPSDPDRHPADEFRKYERLKVRRVDYGVVVRQPLVYTQNRTIVHFELPHKIAELNALQFEEGGGVLVFFRRTAQTVRYGENLSMRVPLGSDYSDPQLDIVGDIK